MKKVFLVFIFMLGMVAYFKQPSTKASEPKVNKDDFSYDISFIDNENKENLNKIIERRTNTEKKLMVLEEEIVELNKENKALLEKVNEIKVVEPIVDTKDTAQVDSVKIKPKKSFIKRLLNKN